MEQTNEMRSTSDTMLPFDPIVVIRDVMKQWLVIILAALAVGVGTYILTDMEYAPRYQAKATLVVTSHSSSATVYSHLSSTTELASVFTELINSSVMRKKILKKKKSLIKKKLLIKKKVFMKKLKKA